MIRTQIFYLGLLVTVILLNTCFCSDTVEVKLKQGLVSGTVGNTFLKNQNYFAFKGIPYAEAPVGELRFKPPKRHQGWEGTLEAHEDKPTCVQLNTKMRNGQKFGISGSEDCLYISVFTPSLQGSAAVVVFDYHDHFRTGYNGTKKYSPEIFTEEGVIVVTINHRLSILGYLTTEDNVIPENNGLKDYLLGLQWVKENIKYFGGNPEQITLMGNKGGASLSNIMLYSKKASGLFNAATMQSGTTHEAIYFPTNAKKHAYRLAELLEIKADDSETLLKELQKVDAFQLYEQESEVANFDYYNTYQRSVFPFAPIIEEESPEAILTVAPEHGSIVNDVPVMIGFNSREGLDHASYLLFEPRLLQNLQDFFVHFPIRTNFRFDVNSTAFKEYKEEINQFYFKRYGYLTYQNILEYPIYVGDTVQNYAINNAARLIASELNSPTYYYMFDFHGTLNENMLFLQTNTRFSLETWGASVGDELCYLHVCGLIRKNYNKLNDGLTPRNEIKVLKKMVRLWTNFAKTGNPTPIKDDDVLQNLKWQPIDKESDNLKYLHITKNFRMEINPLGEREKFWDKILKKYSETAVDGVAQSNEKPRDEL